MKKVLTVSVFSILLMIALAVCSSARTVKFCDINEDGKLSLQDAMTVCHYIVGRTELTEDQIKIADYDNNGAVTLADVMPAFRYIVDEEANIPEKEIGSKPEGDSDYVKFMKSLYPDYQESTVGLDITFKDDLVGICYSTWHDYIDAYNGGKHYNIPEILDNGGVGWGPENHFHYWSEPALGYYKSTDKEVIRTHMTQLSEAGVDFIIIDNTNARMYWKSENLNGNKDSSWTLAITNPTNALLDTCLEMRKEGLETPYIVFWNKNDPSPYGDGWQVSSDINTNYYFLNKTKYQDLWVYMRSDDSGKAAPLLLGSDASGTVADTKPTFVVPMTYRTMWGLLTNETEDWSFLDHDNQPNNPITDNSTGKTYYEQMPVCVAAQRNYMSNTATALSRQHGVTFYNQWKNAFEYRPKIVTLTWWNEWQAQRLKVGDGYQFTDLYTPEYSRDIEPMKGGFGDQYYQWMKQYISAYKNHESCPRLVEAGY